MPVELLGPLDETVGHAQYIRVADDGGMEAGTDPRADGAAFVGAG
jgi:gamma-glutamyltranspeptidase